MPSIHTQARPELRSTAIKCVSSSKKSKLEVYHIARSGVPPLHASGSDTNLYLGDPSAPNIVYQYDPKIGVTRILKDDPGGVDFAGMAKRGEIEGWLNGSATDRFKSSKVKELATFDRFGVCGEMTPLRNLNVR